jgi:hypothetical protein
LKVLPKEFSNLKNLEALYLNDETEMDYQLHWRFSKTPKTKIAILENDNIHSIPNEMFKLQI